MSSEDDPTLWEPALEGRDGGEGGAADYEAERPVNLREQRLRLRPAPLPVDPRASEPAAPLVDPAVLREEQTRQVLGEAAGVEADPAGWGWRGKANALGARLKPSEAEIAHRDAIERIRRRLPGTPVVAVCNTKGGGGTTPATVMLSAIYGRHRGHGVVAWDNNETRGTLAARAAHAPRTHLPTTWDVCEHAAQLCSPGALASALGRFLIPQPSGEEILASDQSSRRHEMIGAQECAAILTVLRRHRTMVLIDTGDNDRAEAFTWTLANATALVVPLTYRRDAAHMVLRMLDGIAARGHEHLVREAVVVLAEGSAVNPAARHAVHEALAAAQITRIHHVPFDPVLSGGERIVLSRMPVESVRAWTRVAATLADTLIDTLARTSAGLDDPHVPRSRSTPVEFDTRRPRRPAPQHPAWRADPPDDSTEHEHDRGTARGTNRWLGSGEAAQ